MGKFISNVFLYAMAIALTIFTATRSLDLLQQWLPSQQQIMSYLGLVAFEGGLYFWAFYFVKGAKGSIQRGIAVIMVTICFIAVAVATIMDMLLVGSQDGKLPALPDAQKVDLVVFVAVVIVLNVLAFLSAKLTDPEMLRNFAVQDAEDVLYASELRSIRQQAPAMAVRMGPLKGQIWAEQTWNEMLPGVVETPQYQPQLAAPQQQQPVVLAQTATASQKQPREKQPSIFSRIKDVLTPVDTRPPVIEHTPWSIGDPDTCQCVDCLERRVRQAAVHTASEQHFAELDKKIAAEQKGGDTAATPRPFLSSQQPDPTITAASRHRSNAFAANRRNRRAKRAGK